MWIPRKQYEQLLRRNDDRDFLAMRTEIERLRSDVRGLRTWLQRNFDALADEEPAAEEATTVMAVPGGWK